MPNTTKNTTKKLVQPSLGDPDSPVSEPSAPVSETLIVYVRSFCVIGLTLCFFMLICYASFTILSFLTPYLSLGLGLFLGYHLIMNQNFHAFRQAVIQPNSDVFAVGRAFLKGFETCTEDCIGKECMQKMCTAIKKSAPK